MEQFTLTKHLVLLSGVLLVAWAPKVATAKPFPKRGYILIGVSSADIGRRSSSLEAQRAALRMMSRMMRWSPEEKDGYEVEWSILDTKGKSHWGSMAYADADGNENANEYNLNSKNKYSDGKFLSIFGDYHAIYVDVTPKMLRRASRHNGSLRDLLRYGAFDAINGKDENDKAPSLSLTI